MKTVLENRAGMDNYHRPAIAVAASRTARVIRGLRGLAATNQVYQTVKSKATAPKPKEAATEDEMLR